MGDWGSGLYVASQIAGFIGCIMYGLSCLQPSRVRVLIFGGLSSVFLAVSYALLGGWVALMSECIVIPRNIAMYFVGRNRTNMDRKKITRADWIIFIVSTAAVLIGGIFTWDSWWCITIIVASLILNTAIFQKNLGVYCIMVLIGVSFYFVYDVFALGSWIGLVFDLILLTGGAIGTVKYYRRHRAPRLAGDIR